MRRIITIMLLVCYLLPCLGMSVSTHYCGGKVTSVSVISSKNTQCPCGKRVMKKGCCKDKVNFVKFSQEQNIQKGFSFSFTKSAYLSFSMTLPYSSSFWSNVIVDHTLAWTDPPPGFYIRNLYLLNQVFRI
jgi:hypothetical protein